MSNKDKDVFDELFDSLINDSSSNYNPQDFSKIVQSKINAKANNRGFESLSDLIDNEVRSSSSRISRKPQVSEEYKNREFDNRFDYFMNDLQGIDYNRKQGYYLSGHKDALEKYFNQANLNKSNLCSLENIVNEEMAKYMRSNPQGEYAKGYYDGLVYVKSALDKSKSKMLSKIANKLSKQLKTGR